jgi:hypothetical protein
MVRRLILLLALALIAVACTGSPSDTTNGSAAPETTGSDGSVPGPDTTQADPTWTELPGIEDLPPEVQDELLALVRATEELRGLAFIDAPLISIVSDAELERRVRALIEEEAGDFPADDALYKLLGLLDDNDDLERLLTDLYGEQVAGFYDGETGELVVPIRDEGFSVVQRATMIHELTHSLTDQHFGFDTEVDALFETDQLDIASSFQALIEGDATLTELHYLQDLSQKELGEFFAESLDIDRTALDSSPEFIQDSLIFPYDSGLVFVQALHAEDGWNSVNAAYGMTTELPGSTEQVITPSDFGRDLPIVVSAETLDINGYELERQSVWGELGFRIMLDQILGEDKGLKAADGWGGDTYFQWFDGSNAAFLLIYEGDTEGDVEELKDALVDYAVTAVASEDFVWVEVFDERLTFIAADENSVGEAIRASLQSEEPASG